MKTAKNEAQELLDLLPDDVTMEVILAELSFKARVLHSDEQALRGEGFSQDEVIKKLAKWLDPSGLQTPSQA
jgi:hypothetical protein